MQTECHTNEFRKITLVYEKASSEFGYISWIVCERFAIRFLTVGSLDPWKRF